MQRGWQRVNILVVLSIVIPVVVVVVVVIVVPYVGHMKYKC
jgi:hypothetical protein